MNSGQHSSLSPLFRSVIFILSLFFFVCKPMLGNGSTVLPLSQCANISKEDIWSPKLAGDEFQFGGTDRHAVYWRLALPVIDPSQYPDAYFELRGEFPHASYFSFHVNARNTKFIDKLTDFEIVPEPGSKNPFQGDGQYRPGNVYRVKIVNKQMPGQGREINTLYLKSSQIQEEKYVIIMYRIYEPVDNKDGTFSLPEVFFIWPQQTQDSIPSDVCGHFQPRGAVPEFLFSLEKRLDKRSQRLEQRTGRSTPFYRPPNPVEFIVGDNYLGMIRHAFPIVPDFLAKEHPTGANMDTRYLAGFLDPSFEAAVLRFRPPTVKEQVRYWSVGIYQPFNGLMYARAVVSHKELQRDPDGYITIVFTAEKDKRASLFDPISRQPSGGKYNWLPYGGSYPLVWFRYLVPTPSFEESLLNYKGPPYDALAVCRHMKSYYPSVRYMTLKELDAHLRSETLSIAVPKESCNYRSEQRTP